MVTRLIKIILFLILLFNSFCYGSSYSKIKIYGITNEKIKIIAGCGLPVEDAFFNSVDNSIEIIASKEDIANISKQGLSFQVIIEDMDEWFRINRSGKYQQFNKKSMSLPSGFRYGSLAGYPTIEEYNSMLDTLYLMYPGLVKRKESIGKTYEGRDVYLIRISNYSNSSNKQKILYTGLHHAREVASVTTPLYYMFYILENYGKDPVASSILDSRELFFVPMVNPDGYAYNQKTNPNGGGQWRKNRTPYDNGIGVDLNRNYSYNWGYDDYGSSSYSWYEIYRGPKAFSEQETQAVKNLCEQNEFISAVNYHSYGNLIVYPWGYANKQTNDSIVFRKIAGSMAGNNAYLSGNSYKTVGYFVNGDSDDWMYGNKTTVKKIYAMSIELGTGSDYFWPSFERIEPLAKENIFSNSYLALVSGSYIDSVEIAGASGAGIGDTANLSVSFYNNGLEAASGVKARVLTDDPSLEIIIPSVQVGNIDAFQKSSAGIFKVIFKNNPPLGYVGKYKVTADYNGLPLIKEFTFTRERNKPVEYTSMAVMMQNNKMVLTWSTLAEDAHSGFVVERKLSGENFKEVAVVPSKGSKGYSYSYEDMPVKTGSYIYRIKTYDGKRAKISGEVKSYYRFYPLRYNLAQNFPNPANPSTTISFSLPKEGMVSLKLYNVLGEEVLVLLEEFRSAGDYTIPVNLSNLPSQVYFYELKTNDFKMTKRMIVLK